jgi:hypothetical protein
VACSDHAHMERFSAVAIRRLHSLFRKLLAKSCQKSENIPSLLCLSPTDIVAGGTPSNALAK